MLRNAYFVLLILELLETWFFKEPAADLSIKNSNFGV
jgi:hypothetical protein